MNGTLSMSPPRANPPYGYCGTARASSGPCGAGRNRIGFGPTVVLGCASGGVTPVIGVLLLNASGTLNTVG